MELILSNHSSYPRIGDSAEHQVLRRTITQRDKGEKADADLRAAEDQMTELAIREQVDAGLDVVTDGQIRWYDPISHLAGKMSGVRINGLLRLFDTNFYFRQPVVHAAPKRTQPLVLDEFNFARANSSKPVKPVLTGPYTLARLSLRENGAGGAAKLVDDYAAAVAEEVAALAAAGATLIQVDEPALLKSPGDFPQVERGIATLASRRGAAHLALAVYFGDCASVYERLQELPVDALVLDFTYNPRLVDIVRGAGSSKALALGLVDGRNTKLEDPKAIARSLERILGKTSGRYAYLTPSCGVEYLPRDRAQSKLKHLATIKKDFLGSMR